MDEDPVSNAPATPAVPPDNADEPERGHKRRSDDDGGAADRKCQQVDDSPVNADYSPTSPADSEKNLDVDIDYIRELGMHREPLIPVMQNVIKMRKIAAALHSMDWEAESWQSRL